MRLYLYGFHMPLFFVVSGVFHKNTGKVNWYYYSRSILWPILIFIVLSIITNVLFYGAQLSAQLRYYFIDIPLGKIKDILWFLFALFWCKVLLDLFFRFHNKLFYLCLWACLLFIPVFIFQLRLPYALSQGMMAFPFYAVGFWGKDFLKQLKPSFKWVIPCISCLVMTFLITKYLQGRVSMLGVHFGNLPEMLLGDSAKNLPFISKALLRFSSIILFYVNGFIGSTMLLSFSLLPFPKTKIITSLSKSLINRSRDSVYFHKLLLESYWAQQQLFGEFRLVVMCVSFVLLNASDTSPRLSISNFAH